MNKALEFCFCFEASWVIDVLVLMAIVLYMKTAGIKLSQTIIIFSFACMSIYLYKIFL